MAIYHFSAKVISRAAGSSAVAAAAYRSAERLHDERLGRSHDFTNKAGVVHSEILLPDGAPDVWQSREQLWNDVEAAELRKDAQLAREIEFAIPREMNKEQGIELAHDFVSREFVARGMVADLNVHWDIGADGLAKPHAHVMLTMREVATDESGDVGFGAKVREWNRTELLTGWREAWSAHVNERLATLDIDARVDHRSLEAQGIDLEPQHKIGPAASRMAAQGLTSERCDEHLEIARSNGDKLRVHPDIALDAITQRQATFTTRDLAMFVHRHSDGKDQFDAVMAAIKASPDLVPLGQDGRGEERFTSRAMIEAEQRLERATVALEACRHHGVEDRHREAAIARAKLRGFELSAEQRGALEHVTSARGISNVIGYAGTGKSAMLGTAKDAWEAAGYQVQGAALSGIAAEGLEHGSKVASRTLASLEHQWANGRDLLTDKHVLVIDEAGMIGTRQLERIAREVERRGAKLVLVGDPEQLQAIDAGAAFRAAAERHGAVEILSVRRQHEDWQRDATRELATGRTGEAIARYAEQNHIHVNDTREAARSHLITAWDRDRQQKPAASRIILTHTNDEVRALNEEARARMRASGALGVDIGVTVERGERSFAPGDRIMFLKNERSLGVKNGSLGTVRQVDRLRMAVMLDDGRSAVFDLKDYAHVDHGYAATIHKAQGMTVDNVHVLATPGMDRHSAYVALSRHRSQVDLHYGRDDFADRAKLVRALSRERGKDMASDYLERSPPKQIAEKLRGNIFAGLKLRQDIDPALSVKVAPPKLETAVQRLARATGKLLEVTRAGETPLPHERQEYQAAARALNGVRPKAAEDLREILLSSDQIVEQASRGQTTEAIAAMNRQALIRQAREQEAQAAERRVDVFVKEWQQQSVRFQALRDNPSADAYNKARAVLNDMAKSLHRDPQLESLLRNKRIELGLGGHPEQSLSQELQRSLGPMRGLGISM
jgi:Ti-type conjugative transfer relaxase TraA